MARAIISDRRSAYADFVADPLLDYIRHLPRAERAKVNRYLRARYNTTESRNLPGSGNVLMP
eukprot:9487341-Pyramimonas_sp.AAC.1